MKIRIVPNTGDTRYPHRIQLLDLSDELARQGFPRERSHEMGPRGQAPEIKVRLGKPPADALERAVAVRIERHPYAGQHVTLNWSLELHGLREGLADLRIQLPRRKVLKTRVRLWDEQPEAIDLAPPPERIEVSVNRIIRDTALALEVKDLHNFECQICGHTIVLPDGRRYAEAHHIRPLGSEHCGPDVIGNILCVCPNHHAELDLCVIPLSMTELRQVEGHQVEVRYVEFHNDLRRGKYGE